MNDESQEINVQQLLAKIDHGDRVLLLDVRNDEEYQQWKIEGRRRVESTHVPYFDFIEDDTAAMKKIPESSGELIVVCAKGGSSAMVADMLRQSGIPAKNLDGGMIAYGEYLEAVRVPSKSPGDVFEMWQINRRGKGCLSYVIVSAGEAAVIDPSRNIAVYEDLADRAHAKITRVFETHVHADHVSGGPELARRHEAEYFVQAGSEFEMKYRTNSLEDGDEVRVGKVTIKVLQTPGHTPGSVCYLIAERYLISGDTLFTSSVGRPDLGGRTAYWAKSLYHTLLEKLGTLSPEVRVFPAHYAGPSEIREDGTVSARLGDLRERLPEFHVASEQAFVDAMVRGVKTPPASYAEIIRTNLGGLSPDTAHMTEWELGKNQCAANPQH